MPFLFPLPIDPEGEAAVDHDSLGRDSSALSEVHGRAGVRAARARLALADVHASIGEHQRRAVERDRAQAPGARAAGGADDLRVLRASGQRARRHAVVTGPREPLPGEREPPRRGGDRDSLRRPLRRPPVVRRCCLAGSPSRLPRHRPRARAGRSAIPGPRAASSTIPPAGQQSSTAHPAPPPAPPCPPCSPWPASPRPPWLVVVSPSNIEDTSSKQTGPQRQGLTSLPRRAGH